MAFENLNSHLDLSGGYQGKLFLGTVVENVDPLNISRIQATVQGLYEDGDLPWVGPVKFSPFGCGLTWGVYGSPEIGSDVLILLQDGDPHYPVYWSVQSSPSADFASGKAWGFKDPYGNFLRMDAAKNVKFSSASGVTLNINSDGSLKVYTPVNLTVDVDGECKINAPTVEVNSEITLNGNTTLNGNFTLNGNYESNGNMTNNGTNVGSSHSHPDPQGDSTGTAQ